MSIVDEGAGANDEVDDDQAFEDAIALVRSGQKDGVWIPAGFFRLGQRLDFLHGDNIPIRGAGMAHTVVFGSKSGPADTSFVQGFRNFGFNATEGGAAMQLSDLTLLADGVTREDGGKMIGGAWSAGTEISNVYFQGGANAIHTNQTSDARDTGVTGGTYYDLHTRSHGVTLRDCRVRDLAAGGIIIVSGAHNFLIENCHVRGSGDDSFAIWSVDSTTRTDADTTRIVMKSCTAEAPARGDGFAIYGGYHNLLENVVATDSNRAGIWVASNFDPLPFGRNEHEMTAVRDFWLSRCGRADSVDEPHTSGGYDPYKPLYRPGTEVFRGALRLTAQTYRSITGWSTPPTLDDCGRAVGGVGPTFAYKATPLANVLVQGGIITGSTNNGVHFNWHPNLTTYTAAPFDNAILSNITIDGIGTAPAGDPAFAAVAAPDANLTGAVLMNQIAISNATADVTNPLPSNFDLVDATTSSAWQP